MILRLMLLTSWVIRLWLIVVDSVVVENSDVVVDNDVVDNDVVDSDNNVFGDYKLINEDDDYFYDEWCLPEVKVFVTLSVLSNVQRILIENKVVIYHKWLNITYNDI